MEIMGVWFVAALLIKSRDYARRQILTHDSNYYGDELRNEFKLMD
jgi:hypothetical protein